MSHVESRGHQEVDKNSKITALALYSLLTLVVVTLLLASAGLTMRKSGGNLPCSLELKLGVNETPITRPSHAYQLHQCG
jgi:hypothetical protein